MKFTIYGNPVEHSKSPQMHNSGFKKINYDGNYSKTHLIDGTTLKQNFIENNISGANITIPYKEEAFLQADEIVGLASKIGAVNTYINDNGKIKAYNTDAPGFMKAIEEFNNIKTVLLFGAGGTAKAIAVALKEKSLNVAVLNRSINNRDFFLNIGCKFYDWDTMRLLFSGEGVELKYDLIINSTSAGLKDNNYPAPLEFLKRILINTTYVIDCIYGKITPFLSLADKYNITNKDGEDMLLYQGVLAFELFTSTKATDKLIEAMRKGLRSN
jgi:shikimate dehydrogenase